MTHPSLATFKCSPVYFKPGTRLIVYYTGNKPARVRRMVEKWAGDHIEVLVINPHTTEIKIDESNCRSLEPISTTQGKGGWGASY